MRTAFLVIFAFLVSSIVARDSSDSEEDRVLTMERDRVWPLLRGCCKKAVFCPDKSDIRNYFKCKDELGECMDIRVEDLKGDAVDGCDLIYSGNE